MRRRALTAIGVILIVCGFFGSGTGLEVGWTYYTPYSSMWSLQDPLLHLGEDWIFEFLGSILITLTWIPRSLVWFGLGCELLVLTLRLLIVIGPHMAVAAFGADGTDLLRSTIRTVRVEGLILSALLLAIPALSIVAARTPNLLKRVERGPVRSDNSISE